MTAKKKTAGELPAAEKPKLWWATLNPRSPRYQEWVRILGMENAEVPLDSPREFTAQLGEEKVGVYRLKVTALSNEQVARLVGFLALKFDASAEEIMKDLSASGMPIRAADVIVSYSIRAFL